MLIVLARINAGLLQQFKGQTVRLTAKVIKLTGETATVEASDGGQVSSLSIPCPSSTFNPALTLFAIHDEGPKLMYRSDYISPE